MKYDCIDVTEKYLRINNNFDNAAIEFVMKLHEGKKNKVKFDPYFYKKVNELDIDDETMLIKHIYHQGINNGLIYHSQQLSNALRQDVEIYQDNDKLYIQTENGNEYLPTFLKDTIYNKKYDDHINDIQVMDVKINEEIKPTLLICVFVGDYLIGFNLLQKIITYKNNVCKDDFYIGIVFRNEKLLLKLEYIIEQNFPNYVTFVSKEYGNDITPSLQAYNYFNQRYGSHFTHILKLHTKSDKKNFDECVDFVLSKKVDEFVTSFNDKCNCIGHPEYYLLAKEDKFNSLLYKRYAKLIDIDKNFVATTNFLTTQKNLSSVLEFMKNNDGPSFFLNNMYDVNNINFHNSPVHFLERLFGIINI